MIKNIVVIEPNHARFEALSKLLADGKFSQSGVTRCLSTEDALALPVDKADIILAHISLSLIESASPLKPIKQHFANTPVIVLTESEETENYLSAISQGAHEVLVYGHFNAAQLTRTMLAARERSAYSARMKNLLEDYRRHFDNGPIPMWIVDEDTTRILLVNKASVEKYGYSEEEFANLTLRDIRPKEDVPAMLKNFTTRDTGYYDAGYWRHQKKNGDIFYVHVYSHTTSFGNTRARLSFLVDVNDKVLAEKRTKELMQLSVEQKEQLDNILSSINEAIWSRDADTHELLYGNNAYYELYGYKPGDPALKRNLDMSRIHPDDRDAFKRAIRKVKALGKVDYTYRYVEQDGSIKMLKGSAIFKKGVDGKPDRIDGITTDITKEKELYDAIRNSEQKLLTTINNTKDLIWSVNKDLKIIYCNKAYQDFFHKWFGISLDEGDYVLGDWHSKWFINKRKREYERALNGETFTTMVEERFDEATFYFEINSSPIVDVDERVIGVNCVSRDITGPEKKLKKLQEQNERLKEMVRMQGHAVEEPVANVLELIPSLYTAEEISEKTKGILEKISAAANELSMAVKESAGKTAELDKPKH